MAHEDEAETGIQVQSFPCERCGQDLIDLKPDDWGNLTCPNCGHKEAV